MAVTDGTTGLSIVPSGQLPWDVLRVVFGGRAEPSHCFCQRYKMLPRESWASVGSDELAARLRDQNDTAGDGAPPPGLAALLDGEPVGWCAVEPRPSYPRLLRNVRVPWEGRDEDKTDGSVWAITCFVTRTGYRKRGISAALCRAAVEHARAAGARAVEGYPMTTGSAITGELHPGLLGAFVAAGFTEVGRPTLRRAVMRIDFA
jgi:GNAT superfamily N-acetyltransferase